MKKRTVLILGLVLALICASAAAQTVFTKISVDRGQAGQLISGLGIPEEQMTMIDPVLSLVNALGVRVLTVDDGGQVDLSLNDADVLSLGWTLGETGVSAASTLFPNYYLTITYDTIGQMMEKMAQNMPAAGGEGGFDPAAMQALFGHVQKWMNACMAAGQPGEPSAVKFERENHVFDTMTPVTVDMAVIMAATGELLEDLFADPAAMAVIRGMAQSSPAYNPDSFTADFRAGFEEWMAHFPDRVDVEFYTVAGDDSGVFYMDARSFREGETAPFFSAFMFFENPQNMKMEMTMPISDDGNGNITEMTAGFAIEGTDMKSFFRMGEMYCGLDMHMRDNGLTFDVFLMNADAALLTADVEITDAGERSLSMDSSGRTVLAVEKLMDAEDASALNDLMEDIQTNGLGGLMAAVMQQVPELGQMGSAN